MFAFEIVKCEMPKNEADLYPKSQDPRYIPVPVDTFNHFLKCFKSIVYTKIQSISPFLERPSKHRIITSSPAIVEPTL